MNEYDHLSRDELISLVHKLKADQRPERGLAFGDPDGLPVFGEQQQRQFDASPHAMRIIEHGTLRYLAVNDAALKLYGYNREEFLGLTLKDTRHPDEHADLLATLEDFTGLIKHWGPRRHITKSGKIIVVDLITQDVMFEGHRARVSLTLDLTERVRMQELLWQRQHDFEALAEHLPDIVVRFDCDIRHIYVNAALERVTGLPRAAFLGKTHGELSLPRKLAEQFDRSMREVFETGQPNWLEFSLMTTTGQRFFEAHHIPELDMNGEIRTALCVAHDITEHKRVEQVLREHDARFSGVVQSAMDAIVTVDATQHVVLFNAAAETMFGYHAAEIVGQTLDRLIPARYREVHLSHIRSFGETGATTRSMGKPSNISGLRASGEEFPAEASISQIEVGGKRLFTVILRDVTEHKRAEDALRESEERFRQLAENIRQVFWIATLDHDKLVYLSPAYEEIWGRSRDSVYRDPLDWMRSIHPDDLPAVQKGIENVARGESLNAEYRIIHPDGTLRWIRDRSYQMKASDGTPLACGIAEDITDSKRAEQERLIHVLHQRDALVREVQHRIKNKLQGLVSLLRRKMGARADLAPILQSAISQLQSVATIYGLQSRPDRGAGADLGEILEAICGAVAELTGAGISRRLGGEGMPRIVVREAEAVPLALVLNELVFNAQKHTAAGDEQKTIKIDLFGRPRGAEVRIANRGRLPAGFGNARTGGLALVRALLAPSGAQLAIHERDGVVEAVLKLGAPLLAVPAPRARVRRRQKHEMEVP